MLQWQWLGSSQRSSCTPAAVRRTMRSMVSQVIGNVDSGKSTLVGVLTKGGLDDGRGLARAKARDGTGLDLFT